MSWSTSELRVRLARHETGLSPPVKYFYWPFQGGASFVDHLCYFCLVFVMLSCASVYWCLVVTYWERADLYALVIANMSLSHWYPGSGVVLDCIDSWSLPSFLLLQKGSTKEAPHWIGQQKKNAGGLNMFNERYHITLNSHHIWRLPNLCYSSSQSVYEK